MNKNINVKNPMWRMAGTVKRRLRTKKQNCNSEVPSQLSVVNRKFLRSLGYTVLV